MFYYKNVRLILILYSMCFCSAMQGMDIFNDIKNMFIKHKVKKNEKTRNNIQQQQYTSLSEESSEEDSTEEAKIDNKRVLSKEEREAIALQQLLHCHGMIKSI